MIEKVFQNNKLFKIYGSTQDGFMTVSFVDDVYSPYTNPIWKIKEEYYTITSKLTREVYVKPLGYRITVIVEIDIVNANILQKVRDLIDLINKNNTFNSKLNIKHFGATFDTYFSNFYCKDFSLQDYDKKLMVGEKIAFTFIKRNLTQTLPLGIEYITMPDGTYITDNNDEKIEMGG